MSKQKIGQESLRSKDSLSHTSWLRAQVARGKRDIEYIVRQVRILSVALRHPLVPWPAKLVAACAVGYLLSPIQIIPTFIPIIGQMDDLLVLFVGMKLLRKMTPPTVLLLCEAKAGSFTPAQHIDCDHLALAGTEPDTRAA